MYAYLKGTIEEITEDNLVLEAGQVGYNIRISARTADALGNIGSSVKIYTYTLVREDAFSLYGFLTRDDLEIFKKLITVNGIGPKGGLAILSVMSADELRFAIVAGDAKAIAKAPGVGAKTAERVILDLKDKISLEDTLVPKESGVTAALSDKETGKEKNEAIEALTALGYSATDALRAVKQVNMDGVDSVEDILKAALKYLY
ncbi:MAG: Holliday junction branch migration protein RuvA [Lachnospiraceae bacterium]|nr:Holliday junction branch migration protein RuvA [Lachnospiraceae bacterium]